MARTFTATVEVLSESRLRQFTSGFMPEGTSLRARALAALEIGGARTADFAGIAVVGFEEVKTDA